MTLHTRPTSEGSPSAKPQRRVPLWLWQLLLLLSLLLFWHVMTQPGLVPPMMFDNDRQAAFFFGQPLSVAQRIWAWFVTDADIYRHLRVTLGETILAFGIGAAGGLGGGGGVCVGGAEGGDSTA